MKDSYKGQHLYIKKAAGSYTHHGLGLGNGKVIHYSGLSNDLTTSGIVEEVSIDDFSNGKEILVKSHLDRYYSIDESVLRACLRLGEDQYHVLYNNCEHFVEWCISGKHKSWQSQRGKILYSASIGTRALFNTKNPVGFLAGAVAGYAYFNYQGVKKVPDLELVEIEFDRILRLKPPSY